MPQGNKIKIRRGLNSALPASTALGADAGELRYSTDTKELYIDDGTTNVKIGGDPAGLPISTATQTALNSKQSVYTLTRTLPAAALDAVDIGTFTVGTNGAAAFDISVVAADTASTIGCTRSYSFGVTYNSTAGVWQSVMQVSRQTGGVTFSLDVSVSNNVTSMRVCVTVSGGSAVPLAVTVRATSPETVTFAASSAVTTVTLPTSMLNSSLPNYISNSTTIPLRVTNSNTSTAAFSAGGAYGGILASPTNRALSITAGSTSVVPFSFDTISNPPRMYFDTTADTNLYRSGADALMTDDTFQALRIGVGIAPGATTPIQASTGADTQAFLASSTLSGSTTWGLYRARTVAASGLGYSSSITGDSISRFQHTVDGILSWGDGANAVDTNLYRSAASLLATDSRFKVLHSAAAYGVEAVSTFTGSGGFVATLPAVDSNAFAGRVGGEAATRFVGKASGLFEWGDGINARDTNLYRLAADSLRTDDSFGIGGHLTVTGNTTSTGYLFFGSALDTNLYRSAAGVLKTDGILNAVGGLQVNGVAVGGGGNAYATDVALLMGAV